MVAITCRDYSSDHFVLVLVFLQYLLLITNFKLAYIHMFEPLSYSANMTPHPYSM